MKPARVCPSCGAPDLSLYCARCGEKRITSIDHSLHRFFLEVLDAITSFDSKILRSTWFLVSRPGFLSAEWLEGRRVRYLSPLRIFVMLSIVYYLSNSIFPYNAFTTPLDTQLHLNNYYGEFAAEMVEEKLRSSGLGSAEFEVAYNRKTEVLSKTLLFSLIPVIALIFYALFFRKRKYFAEHLAVATHFWAFALLLIGVFIPSLLLVLARVGPSIGIPAAVITGDALPTLIIQSVFAIYLVLMLRRAYAVNYWYAGIVALAIAWSIFHIVWLFRFLLFLATLWLL
ncbi:MAG: DUF3667 domain-containing protein [Pseudomonadota bacterium]